MRGAVAYDEGGAFCAEQALVGIFNGRCWEVWVEPRECGAEPDFECGLGELGPLGGGLARCDGLAMDALPPFGLKPLESGRLDHRLTDRAHLPDLPLTELQHALDKALELAIVNVLSLVGRIRVVMVLVRELEDAGQFVDVVLCEDRIT